MRRSIIKTFLIVILCAIGVVSAHSLVPPSPDDYYALGIAPEGFTAPYRDEVSSFSSWWYEYRYNPQEMHLSEMNDAVFLGVTTQSSRLSQWTEHLSFIDQFYINEYGAREGYDRNSYNFLVTGIADCACYGMSKMQNSGKRTLPKYLKWIGEYAFTDCKLIDFDLSSCSQTLERIGSYAFKGCSSITFVSLYSHDKLTKFGAYAFQGCTGILQVNLPPNLRTIEEFTFSGASSLQFVHFGNQVDSIGWAAFAGCSSLESISFPESLKYIGTNAFLSCGLKGHLVIPDSVRFIDSRAFHWNQLTMVTLGKSVDFIGDKAFAGNSLKSVIVKGQTPPKAWEWAFSKETYDDATLYVPAGTHDLYAQHEECWKRFRKIVEYGEEYISATDILGQCESYIIDKNSKDPLVLASGTTHLLSAKIIPETATDQNVFWEVVDDSIAKITDGVIEMLQEGNTTLRMYHVEGKSYEIPLICGQPISKINIPSELSVYKGYTKGLSPEILPENCSSPKIIYRSEDPTIATVNRDGIITGVNHGTTTVHAEATDGSGVGAQCTVTVGSHPIEKIALNYTSWTNPCNSYGSAYKSLQLEATTYPAYSDDTLVWTSSNERIASVDSTGLVRFNGYGGVNIRVASSKDETVFEECRIYVAFEVNLEINGSTSSYISNLRSTCKWNLRTTPDNLPIEVLSVSEYIINKDNDTCAIVEPSGTIEILKNGSGYFQVAYRLCGKDYEINKHVVTSYYITSLKLEESKIDMKVHETRSLNLEYLPENALSYDPIVWTSSDESVVSVDERGEVTAHRLGTATITAKTKWEKVSCVITVHPILPESIFLDYNEIEMAEKTSQPLAATILPQNVTDPTIIWSTSDETVATVDQSGMVYSIAPGNATITATSSNGLCAVCEVTVSPVVAETIELNVEDVELIVGETMQLSATIYPDNVTDRSIKWRISNETIVTVSGSGLITAVTEGMATIYAICSDITATCNIKVIEDESRLISILMESGRPLTIYSLEGKGILISTLEDMEKLKSGIYVFEGEKVYIR